MTNTTLVLNRLDTTTIAMQGYGGGGGLEVNLHALPRPCSTPPPPPHARDCIRLPTASTWPSRRPSPAIGVCGEGGGPCPTGGTSFGSFPVAPLLHATRQAPACSVRTNDRKLLN